MVKFTKYVYMRCLIIIIIEVIIHNRERRIYTRSRFPSNLRACPRYHHEITRKFCVGGISRNRLPAGSTTPLRELMKSKNAEVACYSFFFCLFVIFFFFFFFLFASFPGNFYGFLGDIVRRTTAASIDFRLSSHSLPEIGETRRNSRRDR